MPKSGNENYDLVLAENKSSNESRVKEIAVFVEQKGISLPTLEGYIEKLCEAKQIKQYEEDRRKRELF